MSVRQRLDWFKQTILPHEAILRSRLYKILPEGYDVEDVVAEVMMRAYAHGDIEQVSTGRAYLFRIARNIMLDSIRREKIISFELVADIDILQTGNSFEAALQARDELRNLQVIIETLPPQCRKVFIARRVHQKGIKEIAKEMGLSVFTVDKHLRSATLKVMQAMGQLEQADRGLPPGEGRKMV